MMGMKADDTVDGGLEPMPPVHERRGRARVILIVLVVLVVLIGFLGITTIRHDINPPGSPGDLIAVTIPPKSSKSQIGKLLSAKHIIKGPKVFAYWAKITGRGPFLAGDYMLRRNSSYNDVAAALTSGPPPTADRFTIPEGFTLRQIADRVGTLPGRKGDDFFNLANAGTVRWPQQPAGINSLEGLLFPSTYFVDKKDPNDKLLQRMVDAFDQIGNQLNLVAGAPALKVTPYQVVIIASMIEREAKFDTDRAKIAEVIYNRLAKGMPLGFNSTVAYGLHKVALSAGDIQIPGPYNTYANKGLPPTPICSPGKASLEAALTPETGALLYFVAIDQAGHLAFGSTLAEQNHNVAISRANGVAP